MSRCRHNHLYLLSLHGLHASGGILSTFAFSALVLALLGAGSAEAMGGQFERIDANELRIPAAAARTVSTAKDESAMGKARALPGVSAVAYGASLAAPAGKEAATSRSELELRQMFLQATQAAAEYSPGIRRALAEQQAAQSDIEEVKGQRLPQVQVGTRSKALEFGSGNRSGSNGQAFTVDVVTPVFDWGRIRKSIYSREYLATAAGAAVQAELESSAFDVTSSLVELGKQRVIVDISQQFVERMDELVKMLGGIVAVDRGRVSELTQARARLLQAEASRSTAQARARDIEINLHKLIGERALPPLPRSSYWNIRQADMDALLAAARNHPIIEKAKAQATSADLQADSIRSSALPRLNWSVGKTTGEDALGREPAWQTNLSMSWSAFSGGSTRAAERAARQRAEAGRQEAGQQALDLDYRIRAANHDAQSLLERAELYRELAVETDSVRKSFYEQWYHLGKRTLLDVLIAENDYYGNKVSEINFRFDGYAAIVRQYASAGSLVQWLSDGK